MINLFSNLQTPSKMMTIKTLFVGLALFVLANPLRAQVDIAASPVALLFGGLLVSAEVPLATDWGLEANAFAAVGGGGFAVAGKYYFNPKQGIDGFHVGAFIGGGSDGLGFGPGFLLGYKVASAKGLIFNSGFGIGRNLGDGNPIPYFSLNLGYRFGNREKIRVLREE
jgi:hypothetical protein